MQVVHRYTYRRNIHTHKIIKYKKINRKKIPKQKIPSQARYYLVLVKKIANEQHLMTHAYNLLLGK